MPSEQRGQLWQSLLGVQRKPNVLADWQPTGELKTAALMRAECGVQAGAYGPVQWEVMRHLIHGELRSNACHDMLGYVLERIVLCMTAV